MDTLSKMKRNRRIEIKVSNEDKELFKLASRLRGFKSLSEFLRVLLIKESKVILAEESKILRSNRDREIFFNTLIGKEKEPNLSLISVIKHHNQICKKGSIT